MAPKPQTAQVCLYCSANITNIESSPKEKTGRDRENLHQVSSALLPPPSRSSPTSRRGTICSSDISKKWPEKVRRIGRPRDPSGPPGPRAAVFGPAPFGFETLNTQNPSRSKQETAL